MQIEDKGSLSYLKSLRLIMESNVLVLRMLAGADVGEMTEKQRFHIPWRTGSAQQCLCVSTPPSLLGAPQTQRQPSGKQGGRGARTSKWPPRLPFLRIKVVYIGLFSSAVFFLRYFWEVQRF